MFIHINNMNFSLVAPSRARKKIIEKQRMELMKKAAETKPFLLLDNRIQVNDTDSEFFSCSSVRLTAIVEYVNNRHMLPDIVDSSRQYKWYKNDEKDITFDYFTPFYISNADFYIVVTYVKINCNSSLFFVFYFYPFSYFFLFYLFL